MLEMQQGEEGGSKARKHGVVVGAVVHTTREMVVLGGCSMGVEEYYAGGRAQP